MREVLDVVISREDAHKMQLNEMDHEGFNIRDGIRYLITPICEPGKAYQIIQTDSDSVVLKDFKLNYP